jgi:hypothetical protein
MKKNVFLKFVIVLVVLLSWAARVSTAADISTSEDVKVLSSWLQFDRSMTSSLSSPRYYTTRDQAMRQNLGVITSFALIDYAQTTAMLYSSGNYYEINPILGPHPDRAQLVAFGLVGSGLFYLIGKSLPYPWSQIFVDSVLSIERMNIEDNRRVYQGWNTDGPPIRGRSFNGIPLIISLRF